ncbi:type II toxin-antitoxin system Phd/YefM family antitoxin [Mycobacterium yunnanensis]|uniref:Antitoxin n=1 Tax=Mycobacterium yunnanensis TaxID=368477 RepID=A0A9X3BSY3_9MYCO|nr:type II toxin-antitoxin system Phd/YefM family antitoxin [Mycobacterium yunnanensis]MCV7420560.1 type II toxin-antitoxin system Phd/YefM family antitoxin [Mycobacterium yunnanensis]
MNTHDLRDLRWTLRSAVAEVVATGEPAFIADDGEQVAVLVSVAEYARLTNR